MLCILGLLPLFFIPTWGLYEKEAGHFDWIMTFLGKPKALILAKIVPETILVASETGNIGLLHVPSGEYIWRFANPGRTETPTEILENGSGHLLVKFGRSGLISLNANNGVINWSTKVSPDDSLLACFDKSLVKLSGSGTVIDAAGGSPRSDSAKCETPSAPMTISPVTVDGVRISVDSHGRLTATRGNHVLWAREESLGSVLDAAIMSPDDSKKSQTRHDLAWLIGPQKVVVILTSSHRLVAIDIASRKTIAAMDVDQSIVSLNSKSNRNTVTLVNAKGQSVRHLALSDRGFNEFNLSKPLSPFEYKVDKSSGVITGYSESHQVYRIDLRSRILAEIQPSNTEYENVPVLVRGDASVAFKYMNPNLVGFLSQVEKGVAITLVDTVTGSVPHQTVVESASADPKLLHFVICDSWVTGHYFNVEANRFEVIAIDLFENKVDKGFMAAATGDLDTVKSAFELPVDPTALVQQYVFPHGPVSAIGVTSTLKGVTPRQVLFATNVGIFAIRKDTWLNPRRVVPGGTPLPARLAVTSEEQLPPYSPLLPIVQTDLITHMQVTEKVKLIRTVPTHLESTSIVVAIGDDGRIFSAPVYIGNAPFDLLSPFFDYWLLYVSVTFVATGVVMTSILARRAELYNKWK